MISRIGYPGTQTFTKYSELREMQVNTIILSHQLHFYLPTYYLYIKEQGEKKWQQIKFIRTSVLNVNTSNTTQDWD